MRKTIPSRKRVAIAVYYLGSTAEYRTIANLFGVSSSFVCLFIKDVSKTITRKLKTGFLSVPKGQDLREVMGLYKDKWGSSFLSCRGLRVFVLEVFVFETPKFYLCSVTSLQHFHMPPSFLLAFSRYLN